jgi:drug/metabolite transporter (DMT)-like permease
MPDMRLASQPLDAVKLILGLGVLGTALAYPLYFRILDLAGSSNLMLVTIIVPVFAVVLDAALLGQFVTTSDMVGFVLVAVGLAIMDGRVLGRMAEGQRRR